MEDRAKPSLKDRYEYVIRARNIHYENYNKWMTYFYVAIAALFVGYYTIITKQVPVPDQPQAAKSANELNAILGYAEWGILFLGFTVSILWYWSSKGYYYWNIHFITLVQHYEKTVFGLPPEERVYLVFSNKSVQNKYGNPVKGANISTSKIAILFSFVITAAWGFLLSSKFLLRFLWFQNNLLAMGILSILIAILCILLLSITIPAWKLSSSIDHFPDLKITQKDLKEAEQNEH